MQPLPCLLPPSPVLPCLPCLSLSLLQLCGPSRVSADQTCLSPSFLSLSLSLFSVPLDDSDGIIRRQDGTRSRDGEPLLPRRLCDANTDSRLSASHSVTQSGTQTHPRNDFMFLSVSLSPFLSHEKGKRKRIEWCTIRRGRSRHHTHSLSPFDLLTHLHTIRGRKAGEQVRHAFTRSLTLRCT